MIKATLHSADGSVTALIGLSGENMARLMSDEPILFDLADLGLSPQKIVIIGGKDEQAIADQLVASGLRHRSTPP